MNSSFTKLIRQKLSPSRKPPLDPSPTSFSSSLISSSPANDIHHVFNYFDSNGDGTISASELRNRLEVELSDEEAEMAVSSSDADGDGVLGFDDFEKMMKEGEEEELKEAFVMYSSTKGCVITAESLKKMLRRLGRSTTTVNDCKMMIGRFDVNGDGVLDFDEFKVMMS